MPSLHDCPCHARIVAAMLLAMLVAGCMRPLAVQDEYFSLLSGAVSGTSERVRHVVSHQRALQAARHGCASTVHGSGSPGSAEPAHGPDLGYTAAREALAALCATQDPPSVAAYGATSNAYRRWVEERVRELPEAAETAAGAAGGS